MQFLRQRDRRPYRAVLVVITAARRYRALLAAVLSVAVALLGGAPAPAMASTPSHGYVTATYAYDAAAYVYDAPALLSPDTATSYARGTRSGPEAGLRVSPGSVARDVVAAETAARAASSTVRVGPGAALENISGGEALRIQNAANRIGEPISLVGSRASGTAGAYSDWDYVISGIRSSTKHSVSSSLPRGATELGVGRQIDIFTGPLDETAPYITFFPSGG